MDHDLRVEQDDTTIDEHINQLTRVLQRLELQHEQISAELRNTRERLQALQSQANTRTAVAVPVLHDDKEGRHYTQEWPPRMNDRVRILNPKQNQGHTGTISGFCSDGKVKIRTHSGVIIRATKNIICRRRSEN